MAWEFDGNLTFLGISNDAEKFAARDIHSTLFMPIMKSGRFIQILYCQSSLSTDKICKQILGCVQLCCSCPGRGPSRCSRSCGFILFKICHSDMLLPSHLQEEVSTCGEPFCSMGTFCHIALGCSGSWVYAPTPPFSQNIPETAYCFAFFFKEGIFLDYFADAFSIYGDKNERKKWARIHVTDRKFRKIKTTSEENSSRGYKMVDWWLY